MSSDALRVLDEILADDLEVPREELLPEAELVADLGFDSLSYATTVSEIRSRLRTVLDKEEIFGCRTVGDLQRLVVAKAGDAQELGREMAVSAGSADAVDAP